MPMMKRLSQSMDVINRSPKLGISHYLSSFNYFFDHIHWFASIQRMGEETIYLYFFPNFTHLFITELLLDINVWSKCYFL